jgi:hypothetical protein
MRIIHRHMAPEMARTKANRPPIPANKVEQTAQFSLCSHQGRKGMTGPNDPHCETGTGRAVFGAKGTGGDTREKNVHDRKDFGGN